MESTEVDFSNFDNLVDNSEPTLRSEIPAAPKAVKTMASALADDDLNFDFEADGESTLRRDDLANARLDEVRLLKTMTVASRIQAIVSKTHPQAQLVMNNFGGGLATFSEMVEVMEITRAALGKKSTFNEQIGIFSKSEFDRAMKATLAELVVSLRPLRTQSVKIITRTSVARAAFRTDGRTYRIEKGRVWVGARGKEMELEADRTSPFYGLPINEDDARAVCHAMYRHMGEGKYKYVHVSDGEILVRCGFTARFMIVTESGRQKIQRTGDTTRGLELCSRGGSRDVEAGFDALFKRVSALFTKGAPVYPGIKMKKTPAAYYDALFADLKAQDLDFGSLFSKFSVGLGKLYTNYKENGAGFEMLSWTKIIAKAMELEPAEFQKKVVEGAVPEFIKGLCMAKARKLVDQSRAQLRNVVKSLEEVSKKISSPSFGPMFGSQFTAAYKWAAALDAIKGSPELCRDIMGTPEQPNEVEAYGVSMNWWEKVLYKNFAKVRFYDTDASRSPDRKPLYGDILDPGDSHGCVLMDDTFVRSNAVKGDINAATNQYGKLAPIYKAGFQAGITKLYYLSTDDTMNSDFKNFIANYSRWAILPGGGAHSPEYLLAFGGRLETPRILTNNDVVRYNTTVFCAARDMVYANTWMNHCVYFGVGVPLPTRMFTWRRNVVWTAKDILENTRTMEEEVYTQSGKEKGDDAVVDGSLMDFGMIN